MDSDCCAWKRGKNDALFDPVDKRNYCGTCWQRWIQSKVEKNATNKRPRVSIEVETSTEPNPPVKESTNGKHSVDEDEVAEDEEEGELEGIIHTDNTLYLLNRERSSVYSTERSPTGALVRVGAYEHGKIVLDKVKTATLPFFGHDPADNCETPLQAYADLAPFLRQLCVKMGKSSSELSIYDPYYCDGGVKRHLSSLGFTNVYNEPVDFYTTISTEKEVIYDVCVTNPPYSGDHVERLFKHLYSRRKPFFVLIPNYVYPKPFYTNLINEVHVSPCPFYLTPETPRKYVYETPPKLRDVKAAKLKTAPFVTFWYCWTGPSYTRDLYQWYATTDERRGSLTLACAEYFLPDSFKDSYDKTRRKSRKKKNKRNGAVQVDQRKANVSVQADKEKNKNKKLKQNLVPDMDKPKKKKKRKRNE